MRMVAVRVIVGRSEAGGAANQRAETADMVSASLLSPLFVIRCWSVPVRRPFEFEAVRPRKPLPPFCANTNN